MLLFLLLLLLKLPLQLLLRLLLLLRYVNRYSYICYFGSTVSFTEHYTILKSPSCYVPFVYFLQLTVAEYVKPESNIFWLRASNVLSDSQILYQY